MKVSGEAYIFRRAASSEAVCGFEEAVDIVRSSLERRAADNDVFAAHLQMLEDPMLQDTVQDFIAGGMCEQDAVNAACAQICGMFEDIDDEYLRARADDVRDVFGQILKAMSSGTAESGADNAASIPDGCILVSEELLPSDTQTIDFSRVRGILCAKGSSTSHVCIIARQKGIPINVGCDISGISDGDRVTVDDPLAGGSGIIADKVRAAGRKLYANAGSVEEIRSAIAAGADGIGLFRTEFLFLNRDKAPSEDEQTAIYSAAIEACHGHTLTIRLLDTGGDKPLPFMDIPHEDNPFLGLRGIRLDLAHPEILGTQFRAILRACGAHSGAPCAFTSQQLPPENVSLRSTPPIDGSLPLMVPRVAHFSGGTADSVAAQGAPENVSLRSTSPINGPLPLMVPRVAHFSGGTADSVAAQGATNVRILIPMVNTPEEVIAVRKMLPEGCGIGIGAMMETPAAALCADELAGVCDFFSIGTNDLTQYICAADRGNPAVSHLYDPYSPAVRKAVEMIACAARRAKIPCGICGELASDPGATGFLLETGMDSLSINKLA